MSPHAYTEDQLVEQPAIALFADLGWATISAMEEAFGPKGTLGRETKGEVVLVRNLRATLAKLNPTLPPEAITTAIDELTLTGDEATGAAIVRKAASEPLRWIAENAGATSGRAAPAQW